MPADDSRRRYRHRRPSCAWLGVRWAILWPCFGGITTNQGRGRGCGNVAGRLEGFTANQLILRRRLQRRIRAVVGNTYTTREGCS